MTTTRDVIRFEAGERVDLGDFMDSQWNARSYSHLSWRWFLNDLSSSSPACVVQGFEVTASGPADSQVHIANGLAFGGVTRPDGTIEHGVAFGQEGPSTQALDFTGQPNASYHIYIRPSLDSSTPGNRIVWNDNTELEESDTFDTRYEYGWDVTFGTSSPGNEWQRIATVVWGGSTIATGDITQKQYFLFEGDRSVSYNANWGGGNDRNSDRAQYGVKDFVTFNDAMRRQLGLIIGNPAWYTLPTTSLADAEDHIADATDAHTASPSWTGTVTTADLHVTDDATIDSVATIENLVIGDTVDSDVTLGSAFNYGWESDRTSQTEVPMLLLCAAVEIGTGLLATSGTWSASEPAEGITGIDGEPDRSPKLLCTPVGVGDRIDFDIGPWLKAGCDLSLRLSAEVNTDDIELTATLSTCSITGTSTSYTTLATDAQTVADGGRLEITFDLSAATIHGWLALGKFFYNLRLEVTSVTGAATHLVINKMVLLHSGDKVLKVLGCATI